jgi:hypothetical protein
MLFQLPLKDINGMLIPHGPMVASLLIISLTKVASEGEKERTKVG